MKKKLRWNEKKHTETRRAAVHLPSEPTTSYLCKKILCAYIVCMLYVSTSLHAFYKSSRLFLLSWTVRATL